MASACLAGLLGLLTACRGGPRSDTELYDAAVAGISEEALMETATWLADPSLEGRLAGSPGYDRAAEEMARRLAVAGLVPGFGSEYRQPLTLEYNALGAVEFRVEDGVERALVPGRDFAARGFSGSGRATAEVVFAGYGLSLPERGWDDYEGLDAEGKIVLAFKQAPSWELDEQGWGEAHTPRVKARNAAEHGAVGLLLVSRPDAWLPAVIGSVMHGPGEHLPDMPAIHISEELADALLTPAGSSVAALHADLHEHHAPRPLATGITASMTVEAEYEAAAETTNVVAILPGRDAARSNEHVILGAHLDHVGSQGGAVYAGANDNASGVATVLAVAEALAAAPRPPPRSVVFLLFSGEEQGLVGAEAYVANPALPLDDAVAMVNVDCVGLGEAVKLGGGEAHPGLWALAHDLDAASQERTVEETFYGGGADAQPFFDAGVPTLYVHTTKSGAHLHQPTDTIETLEPGVFGAAARLTYMTVAAVAEGRYDRDERRPPAQ